MDVLEYTGEEGEKRGAEWSGYSIGFIMMLRIGVLSELSESGRTPVKSVTECDTMLTALKEGFGASSMGEELVPSSPDDGRERSVFISPFFLMTTSEPWLS